MADFFDVLRTRRTIRSFKSDPVPRETLRELIDLSILAPTGMNAQPWAFTVVTNREVMRKANTIVTEKLRTPEVLQSFQSDRLRQLVLDPTYDIFYAAPALVVISGNPQTPSAMIDCQLAAQNLFLAAHAKGLGTCYMGWLLMASEKPELATLLGIPEGHRMMAAAVVGYPDARPDGPPQRAEARVHWIS
jgi:nitroreductase